MPTYHKLVRDRIPELIRHNGGQPRTRRLSDEEFITALARKLVEEAEEFAATPTVQELADLLEVVHTLAQQIGVSADELEAVRQAKADQRGAFAERLLLESVGHSPARAEDERADDGTAAIGLRVTQQVAGSITRAQSVRPVSA